MRKTILEFLIPISILATSCELPGGGGGDDGGYTLVFEEPDHNQIWWPETTSDGDLLVFEWQLNDYGLSGNTGGISNQGPPPPQHYTLCVIGLMDLNTGAVRRLTNNPDQYNDFLPYFSADENYVYFRRHDETHSHVSLCRVPVNGGESDVEYLTDQSVEIVWFDLFRDGSRALVSYSEDEAYKTGIFNLATRTFTELEHARGYTSYALALTADEMEYLALTWAGPDQSPSGYLITVHPIESGEPHLLDVPTELQGYLRIFSLSPDRRSMVISVGYCFDNKNYVYPLDGGTPAQVVADKTYVNEIHWAEDGYIYFCIDGYLWRFKP